MSKASDFFTGGGSSGRMFMPKFGMVSSVIVKSGVGSAYTTLVSDFYETIETQNQREVGTTTYLNDATTDEQVILDTGTGKSGVLTHVITPKTGFSGGLVTIKVTLDGVDYLFEEQQTGSNRLAIGDLAPWSPITSNSTPQSVGVGEYRDGGYFTTPTSGYYMCTPIACINRGLPIGLVYTDSLKISVQCDGGFLAGSTNNKAVACWLDYLPEGL